MPNIYNIESHLPFADNFAKGLLQRYQDDLPAVQIYLPTVRSIKSLSAAFDKLQKGKAILLPSMFSLSDAPQDEMDFDDSKINLTGKEIPNKPIGEQERLFLLAKLVQQAKAKEKLSPANILTLARSLGDFLDMMQIAEVELETLDELCPADYAHHWQKNLAFLGLIKNHWGEILKERNVSDIMDYQNKLLYRLGEFLQKNAGGKKAVIIAGTTGTRSAVRNFSKVIANLPNGAVVLPGLDKICSDDEWLACGEDASHPQYNLHHFLSSLESNRNDLQDWCEDDKQSEQYKRLQFLSKAMRSSKAKTGNFAVEEYDGKLPIYACESEEEEARLIAYHMREALETPDKTAALITPSRRLSVKVATELKRWNVSVDVSAGQLLSASHAGQYLKLIADTCASNLRPVKLLGLLQHPLSACELPKEEMNRLTALLEQHILRGTKPDKNFAGLRKRLTEIKHDKYNTLHDKADEVANFIDRLEKHLSPLVELQDSRSIPPHKILAIHIKVAEKFASTDQEKGSDIIWKNESGIRLALMVNEALKHATHMPAMLLSDYPEFFDNFIGGASFSQPFSYHPRLFIWGTLEARLQTADLMILGGLNEEVWPQSLPADAWMSASMRKNCNLPPLEQRIGLGAHDFCQALTAGAQVILTYAKRRGHTPMSPARWIERIEAALQNKKTNTETQKQHWHKLLNGNKPSSITFPQPHYAPPIEVRPKALSVTRFSLWRKDPYAVYADRILKLKALDKIEKPSEAAAKGTLIHRILELVIQKSAKPDKSLFTEIATQELNKMVLSFRERSIITHKLKSIGEWFIQKQAEHNITEIKTECRGEMKIPNDWVISGTADRIDFDEEGNCYIIDYKSGGSPSAKDMIEGREMQLPLEAWMAAEGAFAGKKAEAKALEIWRISGQFTPFGSSEQQGGEVARSITGDDLEAAINNNKETALKLMQIFADENFAYFCFPDSTKPPQKKYNDYAYFERLDEWTIHGDLDE